MASLNSAGAGVFATTEAAGGFAATEAAGGFATTEAAGGFATTEAAGGFATTEAAGAAGSSAVTATAGTSAIATGGTTTAPDAFAIADAIINQTAASTVETETASNSTSFWGVDFYSNGAYLDPWVKSGADDGWRVSCKCGKTIKLRRRGDLTHWRSHRLRHQNQDPPEIDSVTGKEVPPTPLESELTTCAGFLKAKYNASGPGGEAYRANINAIITHGKLNNSNMTFAARDVTVDGVTETRYTIWAPGCTRKGVQRKGALTPTCCEPCYQVWHGQFWDSKIKGIKRTVEMYSILDTKEPTAEQMKSVSKYLCRNNVNLREADHQLIKRCRCLLAFEKWVGLQPEQIRKKIRISLTPDEYDRRQASTSIATATL